MRALTSCAAVLSGLAVGGCPIGGDDEAKPKAGPAKEITGLVEALEEATRRRDFVKVCNELLTTEARRQVGGPDCAKLLKSAARDLENPEIETRRVKLKHDAAEVRVRTSARGRPPVDDTIELVRERGEYRISALAG